MSKKRCISTKYRHTYLATQRMKQQEVYKLVNIFRENAEIRYMLQVVQAIRRHAMKWTHVANVTVNG